MLAASPKSASTEGVILPASENRTFTESLIGPRLSAVLRKKSIQRYAVFIFSDHNLNLRLVRTSSTWRRLGQNVLARYACAWIQVSARERSIPSCAKTRPF